MTSIQDFWFSAFMRKQWFGCPPETDTLIKSKFGSVSTYSHFLDGILLYDQLSRHMYRGNAAKIAENDAKARAILEHNVDKLDMLGPEQRCFALMPWRHTFEPKLLHKCLKYVTYWNKEKPHPFYKRFAQATLKALSSTGNLKSGHWTMQNPETFAPILDPRSAPVPTIKPIIFAEEPLINYFDKYDKVVVSVSGGVDSMVCLFLAHKVYGAKNVRCVSIDYGNRREQSLEIQMVNHVCGLLDIEHYVRVIDEVRRPDGKSSGLVDREFYETLTRDIRFKAYADCVVDGCPVILGHNLDDTLENVFSNIKKHKNYNNLFGMEPTSIERGVCVWRPLLHVPKSEIIKFALNNNIPFTYDSTPAWSERGHLRDNVIPAISEYLPGLVNMVNNMKHIYKVYDQVCDQGIVIGSSGAEGAICTNPVYTLDYFQKIFKKVALHYKVPYPKNKSLMHLIEQLQRGNTSRLTVSTHFVVCGDKTGGFRIIKT